MRFERITRNPEVMGGKPCIRGMRVMAGTIVGEGDIREALAYASAAGCQT